MIQSTLLTTHGRRLHAGKRTDRRARPPRGGGSRRAGGHRRRDRRRGRAKNGGRLDRGRRGSSSPPSTAEPFWPSPSRARSGCSPPEERSTSARSTATWRFPSTRSRLRSRSGFRRRRSPRAAGSFSPASGPGSIPRRSRRGGGTLRSRPTRAPPGSSTPPGAATRSRATRPGPPRSRGFRPKHSTGRSDPESPSRRRSSSTFLRTLPIRGSSSETLRESSASSSATRTARFTERSSSISASDLRTLRLVSARRLRTESEP